MADDTERVYSAADYVKRLKSTPNIGPSFVGMVKVDDDDKLLYAHPASCERWVTLPMKHIDAIEHLGAVGCRDHSHALARIHFKPQKSDDATAFLALASLHHDNGFALRAPTVGGAGFIDCPDGTRQCTDAWGRPACCPK